MKTYALIPLAIGAISGASALAQPARNPVLAEQLFEQGRALAKVNDWGHACPKFEASLRYDPTLGTKLNLATCYEKVGKLASAWSLYHESAELAAAANEGKRRDYALGRAKALEARLPRLTITAPAKVPDGFAVTRDGTPIAAAALGTSLYVDPGSHTVAANAPGFEAFTRTVTFAEAQSATVAIPPLEPAKLVVAPPVHEREPLRPEPVLDRRPAPPPSHARRYAALATGAAGVVVAGVGLAFGAKANSAYGDARAVCPDLACTTDADLQRGRQLVSDARRDGNISTAMVAVGGAAIVGGVVLWLTAPHAHRTETARIAPRITPHSAGLVLAGSFR